MALQEKLIACGPSLTLFGMLLKFIAGPATIAIGSYAVGLHGVALRVAIIQVIFYIYIYIYIFFICDLVINLSIFPQVMLLMSSI